MDRGACKVVAGRGGEVQAGRAGPAPLAGPVRDRRGGAGEGRGVYAEVEAGAGCVNDAESPAMTATLLVRYPFSVRVEKPRSYIRNKLPHVGIRGSKKFRAIGVLSHFLEHTD